MEKEFWGKRITTKLHAGEKQIDLTIRALMDFVSEAQDAQADLNISTVDTNPTLAKVMDAIAHLQAARTDVTAGHRRLEQLGKAMGVRTTATINPKMTVESDDVVSTTTEQSVATM